MTAKAPLPPEATISGTNFVWDIPYNTTPGAHFFKITANANATRGEPARDFMVVVNVANRNAFSGSGPDLYPASLRQQRPGEFTTEDARLKFGTHNTPLGRTLVANDVIDITHMRDGLYAGAATHYRP